MKAHVATGEGEEPTVVSGLSNEDWEHLHDLGVHLSELSIVSEMSLDTAVFALQQIQLHLDTVEDERDAPLRKLFERTEREGPQPWRESEAEKLRGVLSRVRILTTTTLVSLGIMGDLETDEDGLPVPVELPSMGIEEQQQALRDLTAERQQD